MPDPNPAHPAWTDPEHPDAPRYAHADIESAAVRCSQHGVAAGVCNHLVHGQCICPGDPSASAAGWNPACPVHGEREAGYPIGTTGSRARVVRERDALLTDARNAIGGDRERDYGAVLPGFERIAAMWSVILGVAVTAEQYAMCQVATKLGRLAETPNHRDSWLDIAGYAALGSEVATTEGRYL